MHTIISAFWLAESMSIYPKQWKLLVFMKSELLYKFWKITCHACRFQPMKLLSRKLKKQPDGNYCMHIINK